MQMPTSNDLYSHAYLGGQRMINSEVLSYIEFSLHFNDYDFYEEWTFIPVRIFDVIKNVYATKLL